MDNTGKMFVKLSIENDAVENKNLREQYASIVAPDNQKELLSTVVLLVFSNRVVEPSFHGDCPSYGGVREGDGVFVCMRLYSSLMV